MTQQTQGAMTPQAALNALVSQADRKALINKFKEEGIVEFEGFSFTLVDTRDETPDGFEKIGDEPIINKEAGYIDTGYQSPLSSGLVCVKLERHYYVCVKTA